jgi:hypothetical protein
MTVKLLRAYDGVAAGGLYDGTADAELSLVDGGNATWNTRSAHSSGGPGDTLGINATYTAAQISALAAAGGLTKHATYAASDSGVKYDAPSTSAYATLERPSFVYREQAFNRQGQVAVGDFPINAWDNSIYSPRVVQSPGGTYYMYYTGYQSGGTGDWYACVASSSDLITWTKSNLGLHNYGGNTNNNIILAVGGVPLQMCDAMYDSVSGTYLLIIRNDSSGSGLLYQCATPTGTFAYVTTIDGASGLANGGVQAHPNTNMEVKSMTYSATHGKYRWWYAHGQPTERRSIGYYDSTLLTGPWTNRGIHPEFAATDQTLQYYDISPFYSNGRLFAAVNIYNKTTEVLSPLRCYVSDNGGDTWTRFMDLLQRPDAGSWDYGLVTDGTPILKNGTWYLYYGGKTALHNAWSQITLGLATAQIG